MKKTLFVYLHGYKSTVTSDTYQSTKIDMLREKLSVCLTSANLYAPSINYTEDDNQLGEKPGKVIGTILNNAPDYDAIIILSTSLGSYLSFKIVSLLEKVGFTGKISNNCINPALEVNKTKPVQAIVTNLSNSYKHLNTLFLGMKDEIINPLTTIDEIGDSASCVLLSEETKHYLTDEEFKEVLNALF